MAEFSFSEWETLHFFYSVPVRLLWWYSNGKFSDEYHLFLKASSYAFHLYKKQKATRQRFATLPPSWLKLIISSLGSIVKIVSNWLDTKNKIGYEKTPNQTTKVWGQKAFLLSRGFFIWIESQDHEGFCLAESVTLRGFLLCPSA